MALVYPSGIPNGTPHSAGRKTPPAPVLNICAHDIEVGAVRGITLELMIEAGIYSANGSMQLPHLDIEGDVWGVQRRAHNRRPGMPKYLFDKGTRMGICVPPSEREKLRDVRIPIILTESLLKALSIIAALRRAGIANQFAVIAMPGVTTWWRDAAPIPDFTDFPSRVKEPGKDGRFTYRRPIYIAFDSNALTNPMVASERWKLTDHLRRVRKHDVRWIDVPEGPGETVKEHERGIDDVIAQGISTMPEMLAGAYPAPDIMPANLIGANVSPQDASEVEQLRTQLDDAHLQIRTLTRALRTPHSNASTKALITNLAIVAIDKGIDGKTDKDGKVRVSTGEAARDFRAIAEKGERVASTNPDGTTPLMKRGTVINLVKAARATYGIDATIDRVQRVHEKTGRKYWDKEIVITPPASVAALLKSVADYQPAEVAQRPYVRQDPCPSCGKVCSRTRHTTCDGCGAETEAPKHLPVPPANDPNAAPEQRQDLAERTAARGEVLETIDQETGEIISGESSMTNIVRDTSPPHKSPSPAPSAHIGLSTNIVREEIDFEKTTLKNLCACGVLIPPGRKWNCRADCDGTPVEASA